MGRLRYEIKMLMFMVKLWVNLEMGKTHTDGDGIKDTESKEYGMNGKY